MREIILDTETTGLDPKRGDRLVEIGCIELYNRIPTGREYHCFINPEREVPIEAENVHGLSSEFLRDKPLFAHVADDFLAFVGDDPLIIHNAQFDVNFLNFELAMLGKTQLTFERVVDTLALARRKHPAGPNTLDALCKRYAIDNSQRTKHGALIDCLLLAEVYVELLGERQAALGLQSASQAAAVTQQRGARHAAERRPHPLQSRLDGEAYARHRTYIEEMGSKAVWLKFWLQPAVAAQG